MLSKGTIKAVFLILVITFFRILLQYTVAKVGHDLEVKTSILELIYSILLQYTVARVGYDLEEKSTVLELTFNHGTSGYKKGNAYVQVAHFMFNLASYLHIVMYSVWMNITAKFFLRWQIAIGTNDVYKTADSIRKAGGKIIKEPGLYPGTNTKVMACLDPDGWKTVSCL